MHSHINPHLQKKAKIYQKTKDLLNIIELLISGAYIFALYITGLSRSVSIAVSDYPMPVAILLYVLIFIPLILILFPVNFRRDYAIEKRFGLSNQSVKSWFFDQIKASVLGFILGYPLLLLLFFLFTHTPRYWWGFGVGGMFLYQLFITILFPVLIFPLFFKQRPIDDEELTQKIKALFQNVHLNLEGIYSFNLSTKTKKENAMLSGLWKTRRVLLADTLLNERNNEEILVVLAHEIGHHIQKHMIKLLVVGLVSSFVLFYIVHRIMILFPGFPDNFQATLSLLPLFAIVTGLVSFPIRIVINAYSRIKEKEADGIALELTKHREAFISLMAGLANKNLAVAYPKKHRIILSYSHPPVGKRIDFAQRYNFS